MPVVHALGLQRSNDEGNLIFRDILLAIYLLGVIFRAGKRFFFFASRSFDRRLIYRPVVVVFFFGRDKKIKIERTSGESRYLIWRRLHNILLKSPSATRRDVREN